MSRRHLRLPSSDDDDDDGGDRCSSVPNPQNSNGASPVEISDDGGDDNFVDVPDQFSPPPPADAEGPVGHIDVILSGLGLRLRHDWIGQCLDFLSRSMPGFDAMERDGKAKAVLGEFLVSDMNYIGAGVLPSGVESLHKCELRGPFVLQVDEIINISLPLRERYRAVPAGPKRCLKLSMTDGVQRVFGIEYRPIAKLDVLASAGVKVVIRNVQVRRGLLMLVPEVIEVLGGFAADLKAAEENLIKEVTKPPRGKRRTPQLPLVERATLAAWPPTTTSNGARPNHQETHGINRNSNRQVDHVATTECAVANRIMDEIDDLHISRDATEEPVPASDERAAASRLAKPISVSSSTGTQPASDAQPAMVLNTHTDEDGVHMNGGLENSHSLDGDEEVPFTYLATLLAKWPARKEGTPEIRGRIKCFLTGVKSFQFKGRSTFELLVYVDDGSLISEVLIDHQVVQMGIGHSPEDVNAAMSSSDKKSTTDMINTMKNFQLFLSKFEGTMLVEIRGTSHPLALELTQESSSSDAWLLLRRVKSFVASRSMLPDPSEPIELSP